MAVSVINEAGLPVPVPYEQIGRAVECVLEMEGVERECEVSVSIVDVDAMARLNAEWRGAEGPTDVLSFECDSPFDEGLPDGYPVELGDIVVAPEVIAEQAPRFGNDPAREFELMVVHSALHLLGYDHLDDDEAELMEARELAILRRLAQERGEDPGQVRIGPTTRHAEDGEDA